MNKQESVGIHQTGHNTPGLTEVLHGQDAQEPDHHLDPGQPPHSSCWPGGPRAGVCTAPDSVPWSVGAT